MAFNGLRQAYSAHGRGRTTTDLKRQINFLFSKINIPLCNICLVQVYGAYTILRIALNAMAAAWLHAGTCLALQGASKRNIFLACWNMPLQEDLLKS